MKKLSMDELNRLSTDEYKHSEKMPVVVVLDNIRSQHNTGSVFRTADAFRVESVYLCGITATPPHREIQKTALGATESVKWSYSGHAANAVRGLKDRDYRILVVEQTDASISLARFVPEPGQQYAVVFGNEVKGVQQEIVDMADECIEIPQMGTKHSLNVSVSAGIVLWTLFKNMKWD
ncbi:MAG: RNA methyltransferase [Bacteroidales bacterium]|nr:RNA methyltransferase [Bacteroidales bacterium]